MIRFPFWPARGTTELVFVMGCGRSGTHWLGETLDGHQDIRVMVENPAFFEPITHAALNPEKSPDVLKMLAPRYRRECRRTRESWLVDKSHPSLWLAEDLSERFPGARFIGIQRNPGGTVASMLRHGGVNHWVRNWRRFPVPNRFLGIDAAVAESYETLSDVHKHTLRWIAHARRMAELRRVLGERMHVVSYERLQTETAQETATLSRFLALDTPLPTPMVKAESLDRWRSQLTAGQQAEVRALVEAAGLAQAVQ